MKRKSDHAAQGRGRGGRGSRGRGSVAGTGESAQPATPSSSDSTLSLGRGRLDSTTNAGILKRVAEARQTILNHVAFHDIMSLDARADAGVAPVNKATFLDTLATAQSLTAGFNLFQVVDFMAFTTSDTPVYMDKVESLVQLCWRRFPRHGIFPFTIVVAWRSGHAQEGIIPCLPLLSPPEYAWSSLFAIEELIQGGASDEEISKYKGVMLAATVRVEAIDSSDERMWRALNLRSADQGFGEVAELTPTQTMFAVMATKGMLEKPWNYSWLSGHLYRLEGKR